MPPAPRDQPAADHGTRSSGARRCRWWARHGSDGEDAVAAAEGALEHRPLRRPGIAAPLLRKAQPKQRAGDGRNLRWASGDLEIHNVLADQSRDGGTSDVVGGSTRPDLVDQRHDLRRDLRRPGIGRVGSDPGVGPRVPLLTDRLAWHGLSLPGQRSGPQPHQSRVREDATPCLTLRNQPAPPARRTLPPIWAATWIARVTVVTAPERLFGSRPGE